MGRTQSPIWKTLSKAVENRETEESLQRESAHTDSAGKTLAGVLPEETCCRSAALAALRETRSLATLWPTGGDSLATTCGLPAAPKGRLRRTGGSEARRRLARVATEMKGEGGDEKAAEWDWSGLG